MADQVDFPDIYIDSSWGGARDGSFDLPYNDFSEINWTTGGDNSIYDYYNNSPTASVTINLKKGETWRDQPFLTGCDGTAAYPIKIQAYGTGNNPMLDGSIDISTASYRWTASGSGTNEWYLESSGGGDPGISEPKQVFIDDVRCDMGNPTDGAPVIGSLDDHQFIWGNNDSLGYNTVYIRDDSGDPDVTAAVIDAANGARGYTFYLQNSHITVDGVDTKKGNGHGYRLTGDGNHIIVKNCLSSYNYWGVGGYTGSNDCEVNNVEIDSCVEAGVGVNGSAANPLTGFVVTGCDIHDTDWAYTGYWEAAGMKIFAHEGSLITKNKFYNCPGGGIRLDGLSVDDIDGGCNRCTVSENEVYGNGYYQMEVEFSEENIVKHNYFHSPAADCEGNFAVSKLISSGNKIFSNISDGGGIVNGFTNRSNAGNESPNIFIGNIAYNSHHSYVILSGPATVIKNNIAKTSGGDYYDLIIANGYPATIDSDYNCFAGDGFNTFSVIGTASYTLAQWQSAYPSLDQNSIEQDPLMTNPGGGDFTLTSGSPCIGIGADLGSPYNIALMPESTWPDGVVTGDQDDY